MDGKEKEVYIAPVVEVITFEIVDSIATSSEDGAWWGEEIWQQ